MNVRLNSFFEITTEIVVLSIFIRHMGLISAYFGVNEIILIVVVFFFPVTD